jgi:hypothetical protein
MMKESYITGPISGHGPISVFTTYHHWRHTIIWFISFNSIHSAAYLNSETVSIVGTSEPWPRIGFLDGIYGQLIERHSSLIYYIGLPIIQLSSLNYLKYEFFSYSRDFAETNLLKHSFHSSHIHALTLLMYLHASPFSVPRTLSLHQHSNAVLPPRGFVKH